VLGGIQSRHAAAIRQPDAGTPIGALPSVIQEVKENAHGAAVRNGLLEQEALGLSGTEQGLPLTSSVGPDRLPASRHFVICPSICLDILK